MWSGRLATFLKLSDYLDNVSSFLCIKPSIFILFQDIRVTLSILPRDLGEQTKLISKFKMRKIRYK